MEMIFQSIAVFCWLLFVGSAYLLFRSWRQAKPVKPKAIAIGQLVAAISLWLYTALTDFPLAGDEWVTLLSIGLAAGFVYGGFVKVRQSSKGIVMTYTLRYLVTWTTLLAVTQLAAIIWQEVPVMLLGLAVLNLGLNLGLNGRVLHRYRRLRGAAM